MAKPQEGGIVEQLISFRKRQEQQRRGVTRALQIPLDEPSRIDELSLGPQRKKAPEMPPVQNYASRPKQPIDSLPTITERELAVMYLVLTCTVAEAWRKLKQVLFRREGTDLMFDESKKTAFGIVYYTSRFCFFHCKLYRFQGTLKNEPNPLVVNIRRFDGDGFVQGHIYRLCKDQMDAVEDSEEDEESDSDFELDETESEEEEESTAPGNQYLLLEQDPTVAKVWMNGFHSWNIEEQIYHIGLLAHNSESNANVGVLIQQGEDKLRNLISNFLATGRTEITRNCSVLFRNVARRQYELGVLESFVNDDLIQQTMETIKQVVPDYTKDSRKSFQANAQPRITESRETVLYLADVLNLLNPEQFEQAKNYVANNFENDECIRCKTFVEEEIRYFEDVEGQVIYTSFNAETLQRMNDIGWEFLTED